MVYGLKKELETYNVLVTKVNSYSSVTHNFAEQKQISYINISTI